MLSIKRKEAILEVIKKQDVVTIQQLIDAVVASESTIRRDLIELEKEEQLTRVHGGASLQKRRHDEPSMIEKTTRNKEEKQGIAMYAAKAVQSGSCIYLDAGSTTYEMIPYLADRDLLVVTNGIQHVQTLMEYGIETYIIGGKVKSQTGALVGTKAVESLRFYRFDYAFLGMNGVALDGYTTPDPEEANVKQTAMDNSAKSFVLADHTKFDQVSFAYVQAVEQAIIITSPHTDKSKVKSLGKLTTIEVSR
ncbi:DeoR/GlpR family DNA-binding transcription regulator [Geomicrobium sediminis]|uniref:DeoR family fructose operon transcriptional repressor n=1 Tax=Geomicrobium sediminis TaxID=1347788 RepID=A0ABS2PIA0_9BACL|nr:DeoR/GlpR family DNA-binding transcription regulator [Geomicrobium sediminis]MBM7635164.1 DeoR family fructose operon transcriptional repressor [Geomicrobium sediminis]